MGSLESRTGILYRVIGTRISIHRFARGGMGVKSEMKANPYLNAVAASDLSSAAILASLIGMLGAKGILSDADIREVYKQALSLLKKHQIGNPEFTRLFEAAIEVVEAQLR